MHAFRFLQAKLLPALVGIDSGGAAQRAGTKTLVQAPYRSPKLPPKALVSWLLLLSTSFTSVQQLHSTFFNRRPRSHTQSFLVSAPRFCLVVRCLYSPYPPFPLL